MDLWDSERDKRWNVQHILWLNNKTPSRPYRTRSCQGQILGERKILGWASEVGDTSEDECPLCVISISQQDYFVR